MLRLTTFGGLALSKDGTPLTGAAVQRSRLSLLALLATAGSTGFSRDKLLLHLWPESDEERARHALKQAVYSLRRELGADDVIVGTGSLSLNPTIVSSDAREFEVAIAAGDHATATALYAGPFLDGFHLKDSVEFDRWSTEQRARYAHMWTTAVERLATDFESRGAWREAAGQWRTLAAAEPLSGRLTGALIRCLAESGDVSAAVSQYRVHEALLREEVGAAPDDDVAALAESIRNGSWQRTRDEKPDRSPPARATAASIAATPISTSIQEQAPPTATDSRSGAGANEPQRVLRRRSTTVAFLLGMLVVLLAVLTVGYQSVDPERRSLLQTLMSRKSITADPRRIVVAPFENKTGDSTLDALGEKTADWFARELSEANFSVVDARTARLSTKVVEGIPRVFRARDINIALAEETGAAYAIVGNYYREGDSLEGAVTVVDVGTRQPIKTFPPAYGSRKSDDAFIRKMLLPTIAFLGATVDKSAGAMTAGNTSPPSLEAFKRVSRAWTRFFENPADTAPVMAELDSAARIDTMYATPLLMKAYVLDVKSQWEAADQVVRRVRHLAPGMSKLERAGLELFDADLRGDAIARVAIAKRLRELSPGSTEMPLFVVVSACYAGRIVEAREALRETDPEHGINLIAPSYWEWRAEVLHERGEYAEEEAAARTGARRFSGHPSSTYSIVRVLARRNDTDLSAFVERGIPSPKAPDAPPRNLMADRQDLLLFAGRELRAHGHAAAADSFFRRVAAELASIPTNAPMDQRLRQAHAFYETRDYARAKAAFAAIVAANPSDIEAEGRLGAAAAHLNDLATVARVDADLASGKHPFAMGRGVRWRADIAAVQGRTGDAVALLERAVRQGHRLFDTPILLTVHLDGDWIAIRSTPAYATMLQSLAEAR